MQDFVPLGTGNSRLMKSNIPAGTTWEQAIAMLNSGTFPYDTGQLNSPGISLPGTPLNKQTLLQDATAALFGLTNTATVDAILQLLAKAAVVNNAGDALETILGSTLLSIPGVNIATGSYAGTGTYGQNNPNSLTFDFSPKIIFIMINVSDFSGALINFAFAINGVSYFSNINAETTSETCQITWNQNSVSWYLKGSPPYVNALNQFNEEGAEYLYLAIG